MQLPRALLTDTFLGCCWAPLVQQPPTPRAPDMPGERHRETGSRGTLIPQAAERGCERAAEDPAGKSPWEAWKNKRAHTGVQALDTVTTITAMESNCGQLHWLCLKEASRSGTSGRWAPPAKSQDLAMVSQSQGGSSISSSGMGKSCKEKGVRRGRDTFKTAHYGPRG